MKELTSVDNNLRRINRDDIRNMLQNGEYSEETEHIIRSIRDSLLLGLLYKGYDVIVDDINLDPKHDERIKKIINTYTEKTGNAVQIVIEDFRDVLLQQCIKNDLKRENSVGETVIRSLYNKYIEPNHYRDPEYRKQNPQLPKAIVVDLDGTLALLNGRNPYNASVCHEDKVNQPVLDIINKYKKDGTKIIIVSARHGVYKTETEKWLKNNKIHYDSMYLRGVNDYRDDRIIKKDILNKYVLSNYNVIFVLEDRTMLVDFYRNEMKLPCFQVNNGDF